MPSPPSSAAESPDHESDMLATTRSRSSKSVSLSKTALSLSVSLSGTMKPSSDCSHRTRARKGSEHRHRVWVPAPQQRYARGNLYVGRARPRRRCCCCPGIVLLAAAVPPAVAAPVAFAAGGAPRHCRCSVRHGSEPSRSAQDSHEAPCCTDGRTSHRAVSNPGAGGSNT